MKTIGYLSLAVIALVFASCAAPSGSTGTEKRANIHAMRNQTLKELYSSKPESRQLVANSAGYAVFNQLETELVVLRLSFKSQSSFQAAFGNSPPSANETAAVLPGVCHGRRRILVLRDQRNRGIFPGPSPYPPVPIPRPPATINPEHPAPPHASVASFSGAAADRSSATKQEGHEGSRD